MYFPVIITLTKKKQHKSVGKKTDTSSQKYIEENKNNKIKENKLSAMLPNFPYLHTTKHILRYFYYKTKNNNKNTRPKKFNWKRRRIRTTKKNE